MKNADISVGPVSTDTRKNAIVKKLNGKNHNCDSFYGQLGMKAPFSSYQSHKSLHRQHVVTLTRTPAKKKVD